MSRSTQKNREKLQRKSAVSTPEGRPFFGEGGGGGGGFKQPLIREGPPGGGPGRSSGKTSRTLVKARTSAKTILLILEGSLVSSV